MNKVVHKNASWATAVGWSELVGFVDEVCPALLAAVFDVTSPESTPHAARRSEYPVVRVSWLTPRSVPESSVPISSLTRPANDTIRHEMLF